MRVLAIIPARAGSKQIPNKNIRLINGHPMIYYAISNAKQSKYITDIIVTTDSYEVQIIAQQMGVTCHWRRAELCGDSITLDAVIYDAIPKDGETQWDYIVTMQPTSPTLQCETLDCALEYIIKNDLDTLISVINSPHLSWREENGCKVPNYTARLNRQYLPSHYLETGAFLISRGSIVNETSRIGGKIDVYEISENESIDVDTFSDLCTVTTLMQRKKVAFYVNGNNTRGTGHIYRVMELADEFYSKPDIYYDTNQTERSFFGTTTHTLIGVNGISELYQALQEKQYDIFINDILATSLDYMIGLRSVLKSTTKIVNFEDQGEGTSKADLVINALCPPNSSDHVMGGEEYYIAPKIFLMYSPITIHDFPQRVFICFGGADPQNYTDRLLRIITKGKYSDKQFVIALGRAKQNIEELMEYNRKENIEVLYDVKNMPDLMSRCDIGITSRGRTAYELAMLGIPTIALSQNAREEEHTFICEENGFLYMGTNPSDYRIESTLDMYLKMPASDRKSISMRLLKNDLRHGRKRVVDLINHL